MDSSYSQWMQQNPQIVDQAMQRYVPPQAAAPAPVAAAQPVQAMPVQASDSEVPGQQIGHPDTNSDGVGKIADMIKARKGGGDSGDKKGGSAMDTIGSIMSIAALL